MTGVLVACRLKDALPRLRASEFLATLLLVVIVAESALAQETSESDGGDANAAIDEVVVRADVLRGQSLGSSEPDLVLTQEDIAAYGVSTIGELLAAIAGENSSSRGRGGEAPVVLLNGRRISGFREIGRYPVEAVSRVEVLSESVSLSYGFAANQRVINFILKDDITIVAVDSGLRAPVAGGSTEWNGAAQRLFIDGNTRFGLDVSLSDRPPILESERDIEGSTDIDASTRSIAGDLQQWSVGASLARAVPGEAIVTISGSLDRSENRVLLGADELRQDQITDDVNLGVVLNGPLAATTWTAVASYQSVEQRFDTYSSNQDLIFTDVRQRRSTTKLEAVLNTRPFDLSAGPLAISVDIGMASERQSNDRITEGDIQANDYRRDSFKFGVNLDAPVVAPLSLPGDITLNGNVAYRDLSDIGSLKSYGLGIIWTPSDFIRWDVSYTDEEGAPELTALSSAPVTLPNARVFDGTTGDNVLAQVVDGGNLALTADARQVINWGAQWSPLGDNDVTLNLNYMTSKITNETRRFSLLTAQFENAFPDRVLRAEDGRLVQFDRRPVRVNASRRRSLRTSLNWSKPIEAERKRATGPRPKKRLRSGRPGRIRISAVHTWTLQDEVILAANSPSLDFLDGAGADLFGATPEHTIELTAYRWNEGLGMFLSSTFRTATRIGPIGNALNFDDRLLVNVGLTYEFNYSGRLVVARPILEETRLLIAIGNLLNDPVTVKDNDGITPATLQQDLLDPFGRTYSVEIRKRF